MKKIVLGNLPPISYARGEAINTLITNLSFSGAGFKKILFTSCHDNEGKSTVVMDTARKIAEMCHSVAIVDADLRNSTMKSVYQIHTPDPISHGLAHYLAGRTEIEEVVFETNVSGVYMVPVGRIVSNPLRLLNTERFGLLLDELTKITDYVLVDSAPLGMVIDAAEIAKSCDGALLVVEHNAVHHRELQNVKLQLEQTGCPILGAVLNKVNYSEYMNKHYYNKSYSSYGYYDHDYGRGGAHHARHQDD